MWFGRVSLRVLADWCRALSSALHAGVSLTRALEITERKGRPEIRDLSAKIRDRIRGGDDVEEAFNHVGGHFPPLFISMVGVANRTGHLPEVLRRLEDFFRFQITLRRQFISQIFWPVFQLVLAICIIALVIFIMGMIPSGGGDLQFDPIGFDLKGGTGAVVWLSGWAILIVVVVGTYWFLKRVVRSGWLDSVLLRIPALGGCLEKIAMSRLCFAMNVTLNTGMTVMEAIKLSLAATDNLAFSLLADPIEAEIRDGNSLHDAFSMHRRFPDEFIDSLLTSEESGTVPETMRRLSDIYQEEAEHKMSILNTAVGWMVWFFVAGIIVFFIFRIFSAYIGLIGQVQRL